MRNQPVFNGIRALRDNDRVQVESLFTSERMYWLTASVATGFALAEIQDAAGRLETDARDEKMLELFNEALREGSVSEEIVKISRARTLDNLTAMSTLMHRSCVFNPEWALKICSSFISYWLFTKLIEAEWQRVLEQEELKDTYMFLDGVIADQKELAIIREKVFDNEPLFDDEVVYLRSHWKNACEFFGRLQTTFMLLDRGLIPFVTIQPKKK